MNSGKFYAFGMALIVIWACFIIGAVSTVIYILGAWAGVF